MSRKLESAGIISRTRPQLLVDIPLGIFARTIRSWSRLDRRSDEIRIGRDSRGVRAGVAVLRSGEAAGAGSQSGRGDSRLQARPHERGFRVGTTRPRAAGPTMRPGAL